MQGELAIEEKVDERLEFLSQDSFVEEIGLNGVFHVVVALEDLRQGQVRQIPIERQDQIPFQLHIHFVSRDGFLS